MFRRAFSSRVKIFLANPSEINKLNGTILKNGTEISKHRGEFLNDYWKNNQNFSLQKNYHQYTFGNIIFLSTYGYLRKNQNIFLH